LELHEVAHRVGDVGARRHRTAHHAVRSSVEQLAQGVELTGVDELGVAVDEVEDLPLGRQPVRVVAHGARPYPS
jgi:hypothetical protein